MIKFTFRIIFVLGVLLGLTAVGSSAPLGSLLIGTAGKQPVSQTVAMRSQGDVYILRGGGSLFSTGLTKLANQLKRNGVEVKSLSHAAWQLAERQIIANRRKYGRRPVVIIGHSLGANNAIHLAEGLKKKGINVDFIASYAPTASLAVPSNVRNVMNYYFKTGGWGELFTKGTGFSGKLVNRDVSIIGGIDHFNIDDDPGLRDEVVRSVLLYVGPSK